MPLRLIQSFPLSEKLGSELRARAGLEPGARSRSPEEDIFSFLRLRCPLGAAQPGAALGKPQGLESGEEHAETQACGSRIFLSSLGGLCFLKLAHLNILKHSRHVNILKKK